MVRMPLFYLFCGQHLIISSVNIGDTIASEGKGEYMYVEGTILDTEGNPIPDAVIETWETDADGGCNIGSVCGGIESFDP